jgi:hypothetical protein
MRKLLACFFLLGFLVVTVSGCGAPTTKAEPTAKPLKAAPND